MVVVYLYFTWELYLVAMPVWYCLFILVIYLGLRIGWLPTTIKKPTELQRIQELLEKIECEIKELKKEYVKKK
jgi:ABC-type dipeptide/oligopeptide/nickel transport system permease component